MTLIFTFIVIFIPVALLQIFMPMLTRRTESFGVSIPIDQYQSPDLKQMRKQYVTWTIILSVITLVVMALLIQWELAFPILLTIYVLVSFLIYLKFHHHMKIYKAKQNWNTSRKQKVMIDTTFRSQRLTYSNAWFLIGLIMTIVMLTLSLVMYNSIPERVPVKFDFQGHVTSWADKSYRSLFLMPAIQFYMLGLFVFINSMIGRAKVMIDPDNPGPSIQKNVRFRRRWSLYSIGTGLALILLMSVEQLTYIYGISSQITGGISLVLVALIIIGAVILSFTTGQGGSRIGISGKADSTVMNRDDDQYWKLGVIYFNPKDPALFVEKRFGVGWTNNFAHPLSWIFLIGIVAIIILISVIFK